MSWKRFIKNTAVIFAGILNKIGLDIPSVPSAAAIIVRGRKVLLVKLSYKNGYALPGGAAMRGETLEQAIEREVKEETGFNAYDIRYFGSYAIDREDNYSFNVTYTAKVRGKLKSSLEGKAEWVSVEYAGEKLVYEDNQKALREFKKMKENE
jgi:ADP-ribose pyrophosphatase YjhB (NUDIX family)